MVKKLIALIIIFSFCLSLLVVPANAATDETIYLNETFDNYAFNETAVESLFATAGVDARVIERNGLNKSFYAKAWGDNVYLYTPVDVDKDTFVISADLWFAGEKTFSTLFTLTGADKSSIDLLTVAKNGNITLPDGKKVGGAVYGRWTSYAFAFDIRDSANPTMDLYINGKLKLKSWKVRNKISAPTELSFFITQPEIANGVTEFAVDNLRVYSGTTLLAEKYLPSKSVSSEIKSFTETTEVSADDEVTVYNYIDFSQNNSSYSVVPKENVLECRTISDPLHPTVFYANRENTADAFMDITNDAGLANEWKFIAEFDLYLIRNGYRLSLAYKDTDGNDTTGVFITGTSASCGGVKGGGVSYNKWTKISVLYDMTVATYSLWIDGQEAVAPQKLPKGRFTPKSFRIGASTGGGPIEYYLDNIRIYSGNTVMDWEDENTADSDNAAGGVTSDVPATALNSILEKESVPLSYIGNAVVFKDDVNAVVYDYNKYKYDDVSSGYPYTDEKGTFMVPADLFEKAFSVKVSESNGTVSIAEAKAQVGAAAINISGKELTLDSPIALKDGLVYLPVRSIAQDVLGKSYMLDRGMHIFSASRFPYENAVASAEIKEPIDSIYRFMQFERKSAAEIYAMMNIYMGGNEHPRILTNKENLEIIKKNSRSDKIVAKALENTLAEANKHMAAELQKYDIPDGVRLLVAARNVMNRLVTLSAAYLVTEDNKYADRAWAELENCFAWPDWNTSKHYLDNSELLYGVAVAFDSLYDYLSDEQKSIIMDKTYELSMKHSVAAFGGAYSGSEWRTATGNWGMVCNGGIVAACLAFGLEGNTKYQTYYNFLLENALQSIEYPMMLFFPDGAWVEGLAYWDYTVKYLCSGILAPLYFSTGTTLDFMEPAGVKDTIQSTLYLQNGNYGFNYGDNGSEGKVSSETAYVIPLILGDDALMQTWNDEMLGMDANLAARTLMWYRPSGGYVESGGELPYDRYFLSCSAGSMKEQWNNPEASCVFIKGGRNNTNHSHLDLGTFCFDTMGERWAVELGKDSYNIEGGYWGLAGWELYAKRPEGQNCVVINPREDITGEYYGGQYLNAYAPVTQMVGKDKAAYATIDLSDAYKYDTSSYTRGFYLGDDRRTLTIQDEISLLESNSDIYWFMHTRAAIRLDNDKKGATLTLNDKKLRVDVLTNASDYKLVINKVGEQRFPTDPIRDGQLVGSTFTSVNALTIEAKGSGSVYITVKLTPMDSDVDTYDEISYTPINQWTLPDGERDVKLRANMIYADGLPLEGFMENKTTYEVVVPYGAAMPAITATSSTGAVSVAQSTELGTPTYVYVTDVNGRKVTYTIKYDGVINVTRQLIAGLSGQVGIPSGYTVKYGTPDISILQQAANGSDNIVDANFDTRWAASGDGVWCEIDLGEVTNISGVALGIYDGAKRQNIFRILVSENGSDYVTVYDGMSTGRTSDDYESYMFDRKVRYIRYEGYQSTAGVWNSVLELAAIVKK